MNLTDSQSPCMICTVISSRRYIDRTEHGIVFEPDNKLCDGHLIIAPLVHVPDMTSNPVITAQVMRLAAMRAKPSCTIIIPVGREAMQLHQHLYVHIYPSPAVMVSVNKRKGFQ